MNRFIFCQSKMDKSTIIGIAALPQANDGLDRLL